jgi:hypothetical protein
LLFVYPLPKFINKLGIGYKERVEGKEPHVDCEHICFVLHTHREREGAVVVYVCVCLCTHEHANWKADWFSALEDLGSAFFVSCERKGEREMVLLLWRSAGVRKGKQRVRQVGRVWSAQ